MPTEAELGWIAGFFDGEGHVSYKRGYPHPRTRRVSPGLQVSVPQNSDNVEVLEKFQSIVGFGKIRGPYISGHKNPQHVLTFKTKEVMKLLIMLRPNLGSKKTLDFQRAIALYELHDPHPTADDYARMVKWQKKKGCPECGSKKWSGIACPDCGHIA